MKLKIGVIGSGNVGSTLGTEWEKKGHDIIYGVRNPDSERVVELKKKRIGVSKSNDDVIKSVEEAVNLSDIILLAVPYEAVKEIVDQAPNLSRKIIIDCINPLVTEKVRKAIMEGVFNPNKVAIDPAEPTPAPFHVEIDHGTSVAEELAKLLKNAKIVKAFNAISAITVANSSYPNYNGLKPIMYICGNDKQAIQITYQLAKEVDLEPVILGDLSYARYLESLAVLWLHSSIKIGTLNSTFGLMRR